MLSPSMGYYLCPINSTFISLLDGFSIPLQAGLAHGGIEGRISRQTSQGNKIGDSGVAAISDGRLQYHRTGVIRSIIEHKKLNRESASRRLNASGWIKDYHGSYQQWIDSASTVLFLIMSWDNYVYRETKNTKAFKSKPSLPGTNRTPQSSVHCQ